MCGKDPVTAALQDVLLHMAKGVAMYAARARALGKKDRAADVCVTEALFTTVTNVNFDAERRRGLIAKTATVRAGVKALYERACADAKQAPEKLGGPATFAPAATTEQLVAQAAELGVAARKNALGDDITGLIELITYGLKGTAAYADHAMILGVEDDTVFAFFHDALDTLTHETFAVDQLLGLALKVGEVNLTVMSLLDKANTTAYGHPEPTQARISAAKKIWKNC